jgi:hypothetical protein
MLKRWQQLAEPRLSSCLQTIPGVYTRAEILHGVKEEDDDIDEFSHRVFTPDQSFSSFTRRTSFSTYVTRLCFFNYLSVHNFIDKHSRQPFGMIELSEEHDSNSDAHQSSVVPDPDDDEREPTTPPSSPIHGAHMQTNALLQQVMQRLVGMSVRTFETVATSLVKTIEKEFDDDNELLDDSYQQRLRQTITFTPPSSPTFDGLAAPTPNTAIRAIKSSMFLRVSSLNPLTKAIASRSPGEIPSYVSDFFRGGYTSRT